MIVTREYLHSIRLRCEFIKSTHSKSSITSRLLLLTSVSEEVMISIQKDKSVKRTRSFPETADIEKKVAQRSNLAMRLESLETNFIRKQHREQCNLVQRPSSLRKTRYEVRKLNSEILSLQRQYRTARSQHPAVLLVEFSAPRDVNVFICSSLF